MIRAGTLNQRVILQKEVTVAGDSSYGTPTAWTSVRNVWASVQAEAGSEAKADHAVMTANSFTVRMRYAADVTARWRIVHAGRVLDLISVIDPDGRRRELEIRAVENVSNG